MNITKLLVIFIITILCGCFFETIAMLVGFNMIRRYAFGLHASNSTLCTLCSIAMFIVAPLILKDFAVSNVSVVFAFAIMIAVLFFYAPSDTASRPLVGKKTRDRFKRNAVLSGFVLMLAVLLIPNTHIKAMITLGGLYEIVSILPITYKLLRKPRNNYGVYEVS